MAFASTQGLAGAPHSASSIPRVCGRREPLVATARGQRRRQRQPKASAKREKHTKHAPVAAAARQAVDECASTGIPQDVLNCCVKLYVTHASPNYSMPWQFDRQVASTSTGFIVEGRRILTCAHCVEHATTVMVKRRGSDVKYLARVFSVGRDCDTAILTVDDVMFWEELDTVAEQLGELAYLEPGPLPRLQEDLAVVGFPSPGDSVCVTQGVASRVEVSPYTFSTTSHLLAVQLDAAINGGNSGGPVLDEDLRCVGIAFQSIDAAEGESQGFFVPMLIVQHFLNDVEKNGKYTGFPDTGFRHQKMENAGLRRAFGRDASDRDGILVQAVDATSDASRVLKAGDIVTALDDVPVSYSGTVPFREQLGERIDLSFLGLLVVRFVAACLPTLRTNRF
jgi:S1-C subfamily serine protease